MQTRSVVISCRLCGSLGLCDLLRVGCDGYDGERDGLAERASGKAKSTLQFLGRGTKGARGKRVEEREGKSSFLCTLSELKFMQN